MILGCHPRHANAIDASGRMLLETVFEAILDTGHSLTDIQGSKTGVYVGTCSSEMEYYVYFGNRHKDNFAISGCTRSMMANRISYWLKLNGFSFTTDTACSSSMYSLEQAYKDLREGKCEYAIVCGANLTLHPFVSLQFARSVIKTTFYSF